MALSGGVNVLISPAGTIAVCRGRMLSPDGRCKTFDAAADGYVRSEGCGVIVLKRLSDAEKDGDRIQAVIRGSAVNQDGASGGLTVPNGRAQQRVIRDALREAGLEGSDIDYLEAHGTGTSLGDPIEVQAAAAVLGPGREDDHPLWIGSVKTNIGHLESASGIAGLIKVVLSMEHDTLPRHLHFNTPSPHIEWDRLPVEVVAQSKPWTSNGRPRRAGISSFGFSGTNAHVLLEDPPNREERLAVKSPATYHLLPLSARTHEALRQTAARYKQWMGTHPDAELADLCYTAAVGRSHMENRAALVLDSKDDAHAMLDALSQDRPMPGLLSGVCKDPPKTAWLFTGQGSQYAGMAHELFETQPVFHQILEKCQDVLRDFLERPLLEVMFGDGTLLAHTSYTQPALFAVEMALAGLWRYWGFEPDVVLGHSVGQYAAACVAGVFSLEDGLRLLAQRGKLLGSLPAGGRMAAVFADVARVEARLGEHPRVSIAAYNGAHIVISGGGDDVRAVMDQFRRENVRCEPLDTSHAFHSELMEPALDEFESYACQLSFQPIQRTLICNCTGSALSGRTILDAAYWRAHARQPVLFAESVRTLSELDCKILLEIGPQPVLSTMALAAWPEGRQAPQAVASMRRASPGYRQSLEALAQLYVAGGRPNFANVAGGARHKLELPTYPFQRRRYWPKNNGARADDPHSHPLLGSRRELASGDVVYSTRFGVKHQPWLTDHTVYGTVVVAGATYAALAVAAVGVPIELREVFFHEPMFFNDKVSRDVQFTLHAARPPAQATKSFEVHSRLSQDRDAPWLLHASGTVELLSNASPQPAEGVRELIQRMTPLDPYFFSKGLPQTSCIGGLCGVPR
jgi:acyl transferase domain-containing protein